MALQGPPTQGSARDLQNVMGGRPVAGRTGTTEEPAAEEENGADAEQPTEESVAEEQGDGGPTPQDRRRATASRARPGREPPSGARGTAAADRRSRPVDP